MSRRYDLVVVGGGAAGITAALTAAGTGARVVLVDPAHPGGDCLFTGCVPSKSLIASAKLARDMRTADRLGIAPVEPEVDFARVMERVQSVIAEIAERDSAASLGAQGVEVIRAAGRFARPGVVEADGRELRFRKAVIATGSLATVPPVPGIDGVEYLTNETVWDLRELPERLAILGGGAIGAELGQAFARLGSRVTVVEVRDSVLADEDPDVVAAVTAALEEDGVELRCGAAVERVEAAGRAETGERRPGEGRSPGGGGALVLVGGRRVEFDRLLVATGRRPVTEGLGLDAIGARVGDDGAVVVDDQMRTTADHVYAAGDVAGPPYFTHAAGYEGLLAIANALFKVRQKVDRRALPWVTFTDPEVARVGLSEREARERHGDGLHVLRHHYAESDRALAQAETRGFAKLVADRRGRLIGASIVGAGAGESLALVARMLADGRKVADVSQTIVAYPTLTEAPARAAQEWWSVKYLNSRGRRFIRPLLALLRAVDRPRG